MPRLSSVALFIFCLSVSIIAGPIVSHDDRQATAPKAIYFQSNQALNSIFALPISSNGTVMQGTVTPTGGTGANSINAMTKMPAGPDALASQGGVTVVGNMLFAVNAGSDSLSMFRIDRNNPTGLTLIGQPTATGGKFPVSVAVSMKMKVACVGHSGSVAGISCARFSTHSGLHEFDAIRTFDLGQSNPPLGPLNTLSHTFFIEDENTLITTVKGDPSVNKTGFVSTFSALNGSVAPYGTQISPKGTGVLFGAKQIPGTSILLVTDALFGYVLLDINNLAAPISQTAIEGQIATCWATVSSKTKTGVNQFVTDVAKNRLIEANLATGAIVSETVPPNDNPGMIDLAVAGNHVYALSPGNLASVVVFDISGGPGTAKAVQNFAVNGADKSAQGQTQDGVESGR